MSIHDEREPYERRRGLPVLIRANLPKYEQQPKAMYTPLNQTPDQKQSEQPGEIPLIIESLFAIAEHLKTNQKALDLKLRPIARSYPVLDQASDQKDGPGKQTQIGNQLAALYSRLVELNESIKELEQHIEL